jgi:hypothetical protein
MLRLTNTYTHKMLPLPKQQLIEPFVWKRRTPTFSTGEVGGEIRKDDLSHLVRGRGFGHVMVRLSLTKR